jgi:prepilin signal peptidase PulO-like enzyme (type II secretory pathway)
MAFIVVAYSLPPLRSFLSDSPGGTAVHLVLNIFGVALGFAGVFGGFILIWGMFFCAAVSPRHRLVPKILWMLGILIFNVLAAVIYYFAVYRRQTLEAELQRV